LLYLVEDNNRIYPIETVKSDNKTLNESVLLCASYEDTIWFYSPIHKEVNSNATLISETPALRLGTNNYSGYYYCYGTYSGQRSFIALRIRMVNGKHYVMSIIMAFNNITDTLSRNCSLE